MERRRAVLLLELGTMDVFATVTTEIKVCPTSQEYKVTREVQHGLGTGRVYVGSGRPLQVLSVPAGAVNMHRAFWGQMGGCGRDCLHIK